MFPKQSAHQQMIDVINSWSELCRAARDAGRIDYFQWQEANNEIINIYIETIHPGWVL